MSQLTARRAYPLLLIVELPGLFDESNNGIGKHDAVGSEIHKPGLVVGLAADLDATLHRHRVTDSVPLPQDTGGFSECGAHRLALV